MLNAAAKLAACFNYLVMAVNIALTGQGINLAYTRGEGGVQQFPTKLPPHPGSGISDRDWLKELLTLNPPGA